MSPNEILEALIASGTPTRLVVEVARIFEQIEGDFARRERDRIRKRNQRSRPRTSMEFRGHPRTSADSPLAKKEMSPHTPLKEKNSTPIPFASRTADDQSQRDIRDDLFKHGLQMLAEMTGKTPDSCRSLVGKWLKAVDDEAIHILGAIEDAHRNQIADPVSWIFERLKPFMRGQLYGHRKQKTTRDVGEELVAELRTTAGSKADNRGGHNGCNSHAVGISGNGQGLLTGIFDDAGANIVPISARGGDAGMFADSRGSPAIQIIPPNGRTNR